METQDALIAVVTAVVVFAVLVGFDYARGVAIEWLLDGAVAAVCGGITYYARTNLESAD